MRSLARDIKITLLIKFSLLTLLWFFCFKDTAKPIISTQQWMLGSDAQQDARQPTLPDRK